MNPPSPVSTGAFSSIGAPRDESNTQEVGEPENTLVPHTPRARYPGAIIDGQVIQPERPLAIAHEADVLVVGGGPAGFAAAVSAARTGAKTILLERFGYLGGLWTGGLVLLIYPTYAMENGVRTKVLRGVGEELLGRIARIRHGIVDYNDCETDPTSDPEVTKVVMDEMIQEAGVTTLFHCWVADVVMDGSSVRGVIVESKSGRQAVLAKVVVDASGDGDVFAAAGAEFELHHFPIGLVHRLGNVDRVNVEKLKAAGARIIGNVEPLPGVKWVNHRGESADGLDVTALSRLEMAHRRSIWERVQRLRATPGAEDVFLLQTAPQLGVRVTRLLVAVKQLKDAERAARAVFPDAIGVGGTYGSGRKNPGWRIPYGCMIPRTVDNVIAAGRCISVDLRLIEDMRLIATCLVTGHAAGAAAALSARCRCRPRDIDVADLQNLLRSQGAYLGCEAGADSAHRSTAGPVPPVPGGGPVHPLHSVSNAATP
jgi:hypothetical protein